MISIAFFDDQIDVGRIVSARIEIASIDDFVAMDSTGVQLHVVQRDADAAEDCTSIAAPFFAVERSRRSQSSSSSSSSGNLEAPTVLRFYSLHESVVNFLTEQDNHSFIEDGELLRFAFSTCGVDAGLNPFAAFFQKLRPLEVENALLRSALGFGKRDVVDLISIKKKLGNRGAPSAKRGSVPSTGRENSDSHNSNRYNADDTTQTLAGDGKAVSTAANLAVSGNVTNPNTTAGSDPFSIHAPHLWEMETDAAINARTKYQPYRTHSPSGRKLDLVTQQHLVVRLHDKSVDMLRYRRSGRSKEVDPAERRCLTPDEQQELATRLHDRQREHTAKVIEELTTKFKPNLSPKRVLSPDELRTSTDRIYQQPMERKRVNLEKLVQKYVYDEEDKIPKVKLSVERQKAMGDRLSKK